MVSLGKHLAEGALFQKFMIHSLFMLYVTKKKERKIVANEN